MERTYIMLKPDAVRRGLAGTIISRIEAKGYRIVDIKVMSLGETILREHYRHICDKPFYPELEAFMAIAGYAVGANQGYVYVRAEYPLAIEVLEQAIKDARKRNILGKNIFGGGFDFDVDIRIGAGAFVCGEETALMKSVEGKRGEPNQKPPYPADQGLYGKPTVINNVETLGNISAIILKGAEWFSRLGTEKSKGTKVFALAGDINNTGLIEVPMGAGHNGNDGEQQRKREEISADRSGI